MEINNCFRSDSRQLSLEHGLWGFYEMNTLEKSEKFRRMRKREEAAYSRKDGNAGRNNVCKVATGNRDEQSGDWQSTVGSKSGDGRNIYYLHTCHQRTHESVDQFFIRCKVRTSS